MDGLNGAGGYPYAGDNEEAKYRALIREEVSLAMVFHKTEIKEQLELRFDRLRNLIIGGFVVVGVMISVSKFLG